MPIGSLLDYIALKNVSLYLLLAYLDITDILKHVGCNFYSNKDWHFKYDLDEMIKRTTHHNDWSLSVFMSSTDGIEGDSPHTISYICTIGYECQNK